MRECVPLTISVQGPTQEFPMFGFPRASSTPKVKDFWGIPVARISGQQASAYAARSAKFIARKAEMWLKEAGATQTWAKLPGPGVSGGQHQAGTCRMGNDPQDLRGEPILPGPRRR